MADEARRRLGRQQAELIASLTLRSPAPAGMDLERVAVTRRQLAFKRLRIVARAWPSLPQALGEDFERVALDVLADVPMAARHHAVSDGLAIAERCCDKGSGGDAVRLALLEVRARWTVRASTLHARVGPWFGVSTLPDSGRLAVAARLRRIRIWIFPH